MFPTQCSFYIKMIKCITLSLSECTLSALVKLPTEHNYLHTAGASLCRRLFELLLFFLFFFFMCGALCLSINVEHSALWCCKNPAITSGVCGK